MSILDKIRRRKNQGKKKFEFRFEDMARIRGVEIYAVYTAVQRGNFVKGDLESMWRWSLRLPQ